MRFEICIWKSLGMKAYSETHVDEQPDGSLVAQVDPLPGRRLCCGVCGQPALTVVGTRRPERHRWRSWRASWTGPQWPIISS